MKRLALCALLACAHCGDREVFRPLTLDIQNISATASTLVVKAFTDPELGCAAYTLLTVQSENTSHEARWVRADGADRRVELPPIEEERAVLVVYTEDSAGVAIQLACAEVEYGDLENRLITLRLSSRMASILRPWRTCSARSSWSDCSDGEGWRKFSSRTGSIENSIITWSSSAFDPISRTTRST
jgi:hypothetical protein